MEKDFDLRYAAFELHMQVEALGIVWKDKAALGEVDMSFDEVSSLTRKARAFVDVLEVRLPELMEVLVTANRDYHAGENVENTLIHALKQMKDEAPGRGFSADEPEFIFSALLLVDPKTIKDIDELYRPSEATPSLAEKLGLRELPTLLLEPANDITPLGKPPRGKEPGGKGG